MDSLHIEPPITQFRCMPFTAAQPAPFDYRPEVERAKLETAWRELNEQGAASWMKIVSLWIAATAISMGLPCTSLAGTGNASESYSCETATNMSACSLSSNSERNLRGRYEH